jgi:tetratricopeptide (TPR) repeat protein
MERIPLLALLLFLFSHLAAAQNAPPAWQAAVRAHVANKEFPAALRVVDGRLAESPEDLEARGWRARLLAWSKRLAEAEAEYRRVLEAAPNDVDVLLGLADLLVWQRRFEEGLAHLRRAAELEPGRPEAHARQGRVLRELGRVEEARAAYEQALALDSTNAEARDGLAALEPEPRHEFRIGADFDAFDFAEDAQSITASLRSHLGRRWTTHVAGNFQHRFGQNAGRFLGSVSYRPTASDTLAAGGAAGRDAGVIAKGEAYFEYGRGIRISDRGGVRGLELGYRQSWLWFRDARLLVLTPSLVTYFPRDWYWGVSIGVARSRFPGTPAEWRPSGGTRLHFPLHRAVGGHLFFSVGTENFAQADQVGRFSARTYGGGARWQIDRRQSVQGYVFFQDRSQNRSQVGFGFSYGVRF